MLLENGNVTLYWIISTLLDNAASDADINWCTLESYLKVNPDCVGNDLELGTLLLKGLFHYSREERNKLRKPPISLANNAANIRMGSSRIKINKFGYILRAINFNTSFLLQVKRLFT